jgi:hypothetical protein
MGLSQVQSVIGTSFIPDVAETGILSERKTLDVAEAKSPGGLYESILLAASFVLLLFGLLPPRPEQFSASRVTGERTGT